MFLELYISDTFFKISQSPVKSITQVALVSFPWHRGVKISSIRMTCKCPEWYNRYVCKEVEETSVLPHGSALFASGIHYCCDYTSIPENPLWMMLGESTSPSVACMWATVRSWGTNPVQVSSLHCSYYCKLFTAHRIICSLGVVLQTGSISNWSNCSVQLIL